MDMYDRINDLLRRKKLKKTDISKNIGVPYSTLASMFARRSMGVDIETIKKIAQYLGTTVEYLVTGNESYKETTPTPDGTVTIVVDGLTYVYKLSKEDIQAIITILEKFKQV